jgi:hypothetical protein
MRDLMQHVTHQAQVIATLTTEIAALRAQLQNPSQPQYPAEIWKLIFESQQPKPEPVPAPAPAPPPNPFATLQESMNLLRNVNRASKQLVEEIAPPAPEIVPANKVDDDGLPIKVMDVGPMRIPVDRKTGDRVSDPMTLLMFNADRLQDMVKSMTKQGREVLEERNKSTSDAAQKMKEAAEIQREAELIKAQSLRKSEEIVERVERVNRENQQRQMPRPPAPTFLQPAPEPEIPPLTEPAPAPDVTEPAS